MTQPTLPMPDLRELYGLRGKCVIVTGAAAGIGKRIAAYMGAAGARLVIADRNGEGAQQTADQLLASTGGELEVLATTTDVADERAVAAMFDAASERFGDGGCAREQRRHHDEAPLH